MLIIDWAIWEGWGYSQVISD